MDVLAVLPGYLDAGAPPQALTGSSLSAPIVSGVIALMLAADRSGRRPDAAGCERIERILHATARPALVGETGFTVRTGHGVIDAAAAVELARSGRR
jgi:hypothetical protein